MAKWFCDREYQNRLAAHIFKKYYREVFLLAFELLPNADKLSSAMKLEIDNLISEEHKLQDYLQWIDSKTKRITISSKPSAIRAFYLKPDLAPIRNHNLANALDSEFSRKVLPVSQGNIICVFTRSEHRIILIFDYLNNSFYSFDTPLNPSLENILKIMEKEVPSLYFSIPTLENVHQLLEARSAWIEQLQSVITRYPDSGFNWIFDENQSIMLDQYYDANRLLVDCLNSTCAVSSSVKRKLEETLLLPIAELEKRKSQRLN